MVSSPGGYGSPPNNPAPNAPIAPVGQSTAYRPNWISFLGDTNTPSTGLTPEMLAQINASNGPPPGPPPGAMGGISPQQMQQVQQARSQLANVMQQQKKQAITQQQQQLNLGRNGSAGGWR